MNDRWYVMAIDRIRLEDTMLYGPFTSIDTASDWAVDNITPVGKDVCIRQVIGYTIPKS